MTNDAIDFKECHANEAKANDQARHDLIAEGIARNIPAPPSTITPEVHEQAFIAAGCAYKKQCGEVSDFMGMKAAVDAVLATLNIRVGRE